MGCTTVVAAGYSGSFIHIAFIFKGIHENASLSSLILSFAGKESKEKPSFLFGNQQ